jgi:heme oxygenase
VTVGIVRERLRAATSAAHARLHRHPGLSAAAAGVIDIDAYRALLIRLYGFHRAFDAAVSASFISGAGAPRSGLLESDLAALGISRDRLAVLRLCATLSPMIEAPRALGALYVVEGSALGGARIARALAPLLAPFDGAGCRFFSNDGGERRRWPELLADIEALHTRPEREQAAVDAAVETFQKFEDWMQGWAPESAKAPSRVPSLENGVGG